DIESFATVESQRSRVRVVLELAGQHAHSNQITTMDTLETLCDHRFDTKQPRSFRRPVARTARAVLLTSDDHERHILRLITHRSVVNAHAFAIRLIDRHTALNPRNHEVLDAHVSKRSTNHHFVITTPRAITVEVFDIDAAFLQVQTCR